MSQFHMKFHPDNINNLPGPDKKEYGILDEYFPESIEVRLQILPTWLNFQLFHRCN